MDEDITQVDGDPVCSSCLENGEIPHCEHCGEYTREGEDVDDESTAMIAWKMYPLVNDAARNIRS